MANALDDTLASIHDHGEYASWYLFCAILIAVIICLNCLKGKCRGKRTRGGNASVETGEGSQIQDERSPNRTSASVTCTPGETDESRQPLLQGCQDSSPAKSTISSKEQYTPCPSCIEKCCTENHGSTFLFDREQYSAHKEVKEIVFRQNRGKHPSLTIFEEIGQFTQLEEVKIDGINLDDASLSNLFRCTSIRSLTLSNCRLESIPTSLANLEGLQTLDLSHNNLTTMPTGLFRSLPCLNRLNLSHNKIPEIRDVAGAQALHKFDVSFNEIEELPCELLHMESLESFSGSHNKVARWLEQTSAEEQTKPGPLVHLNLSHNLLEDVPRCVTELKNLETLNMNHNKIRVLGDAVKMLNTLRSFDVSSNYIEEIPFAILQMESLEGFNCSHNNVARWLEPSNGERQVSRTPLVFLKLSHNSLEDVPRFVKDLKNLSEVDLSYNKIGANVGDEMLNEQLDDLFCLPSVTALLLSNNNIKTLPQDMTRVSETMQTIDLSNNEIGEVPEALLLMPNLIALYLGSNKIKELPTGLDFNKLSPNLHDIDLSNNEIHDVPLDLWFLPSLRKLILRQNKISKISKNIERCKNLAFLDVSANMLEEIQSYVLGLPGLRTIDASKNQIKTVSPLEKGESSNVQVFALAENGLSHFPEVLTKMDTLMKVDLSSNNIKKIPESIKGMPKEVMLKLQNNPIVDPPLQVCHAGLEALQAFYEDLTTASSITQCLKTLVLGMHEVGKTSLVRTLHLRQSKLTKTDERTHGIEITEIDIPIPNTNDSIKLSAWDFAGQETYYITHQFFLSAKSLTLVVVNLEKYDPESSEDFNDTCGKWMNKMIAKVGNPVVIPVATCIDKLSTAEVERRCKDLAKKLKHQETKRIGDLEKQLERIKEPSVKSDVASRDRKKQIEALLRQRPSIHSEPVPVSSANFVGFEELEKVVRKYAVDKDLFPEVGRPIPKAWADTEKCVERKAEELSLPYMTWDEFTALLKENVPNLQPESRIRTVAQYLHDTGKILWYSEIESLQNHVILKPAYLVNIFRKVFRHDLDVTIDYKKDSSRYQDEGITEAAFDGMKNDLIKNGVLHTKLLRCLWSDVKKECSSRSRTFEDIFDVLIKLMRLFELCYDIEIGLDESQPRDKQGQGHPDKVLLPWYISTGTQAITEWESGGSDIISLQYSFLSFIPRGLFERLTVRAYQSKHSLHFVSHWNTGTLCKHRKEKMLVLFKYEEAKGLAVSLSARPEKPMADVTLDSLWKTLKDLSLEVEDLLKEWPGLVFDRFTVCPGCVQPSFPGEWLQKSSEQSLEEICNQCGKRVPCKYLVPPSRQRSSKRSSRSRRKERNKFDQQLLRVAEKLGRDWESLAIHMGFKDADVYKFKCDHPYNTTQQIFAMLTAWKNRAGRENAYVTKENLRGVFIEAGVDYDVVSCLD
ncbi:uncharacterized protein LOC144923569 [Branchiostoma floridae x Branchiostoma belcheri]